MKNLSFASTARVVALNVFLSLAPQFSYASETKECPSVNDCPVTLPDDEYEECVDQKLKDQLICEGFTVPEDGDNSGAKNESIPPTPIAP